ncbi:related to aminopeptidase yscI precursor, vacuolar [Cephalotrichum gorgonifer]|uniref:Related to aminopeptidase yscI, vacuolar n=1 Tax=Cephalotrichum gorgonifer TaxID=2041049 RepID=A0AAE8N7S0_9PEZI|nr:related to aminopeptidase yscI precursor, vacuolar [Cephalotrichum gorgonifer]
MHASDVLLRRPREMPPTNLSQAQKAYIVSDFESRPEPQRKSCRSCINSLAAPQRRSVALAADSDECLLCAAAKGKPEAFTQPFCDFLTNNPTVFHAVGYFEKKLRDAGFTELPARDQWVGQIKPGGKYFVTRNGSSLVAFTVGESYAPGSGVAMIAGHIDALTARLKPVSTKPNKAGYVQLGVAPYAGALNETWWDRDLSIGGRVIVRDPETGKTTTELVRLDWPIARIPTLAPHFGLGMMGKNNKETEAVPVVGLEDKFPTDPLGPPGSFVNTQPAKLVKLIASELGVSDLSTILNWELELYDSQPAQTGGLDREFIFGPRIDDKLCSWPALLALIAAADDKEDSYIRLVALFDDEEIGSLLRQGARGNFLPSVVERTVEALSAAARVPFGPGVVGRTYARSFLASADVTHAGNPNFLGAYLDNHIPKLNVGVVVSADSNGHMTTDAVSTAILRRVAQLSGSETQVFQIRNDTRSGGTVGPMLSSAMGVKAADLGLPQLSMHSIRATTGSLDPGLGLKFFKGFLEGWEKVDGEWH